MARTRSRRVISSGVPHRERGTLRKDAPVRLALGYPAPYRVGSSSLGFQTIYRSLNELDGVCCERFFIEPGRTGAARTVETGADAGTATAIGFSVSCETELLGVVSLLESAGLAPLARKRPGHAPAVIIGGPITTLDPRLVASLADVVIVGDAEEALPELGRALLATPRKEAFLEALDRSAPGLWVVADTCAPPPPARAAESLLPAYAATWAPDAELRDLFLVEATRGCRRACSFCVLSSSAKGAGRFLAVPPERILAAVPEAAPGVGLVGAAVTDHPQIEDLVAALVDRRKRVSLSSIRADCVTERLVADLVRGGARTLTLAADGASEALRRAVHKGITARMLERAAAIAAGAKVKGLKLYSMVGLPGEEDADVDELAKLVTRLAARLDITVAVQAFVPKPGTPLASAAMADIGVVRRRLERLRGRLRGRAAISPTSPRWSWLDWRLAWGGERSALAAIEAHAGGGTYEAWKRGLRIANLEETR